MRLYFIGIYFFTSLFNDPFSEFQSVRFHAKSWLPARSIVMECLLARWSVDPSGEIMVLTRFCPVSMQCCIVSANLITLGISCHL